MVSISITISRHLDHIHNRAATIAAAEAAATATAVTIFITSAIASAVAMAETSMGMGDAPLTMVAVVLAAAHR